MLRVKKGIQKCIQNPKVLETPPPLLGLGSAPELNRLPHASGAPQSASQRVHKGVGGQEIARIRTGLLIPFCSCTQQNGGGSRCGVPVSP